MASTLNKNGVGVRIDSVEKQREREGCAMGEISLLGGALDLEN